MMEKMKKIYLTVDLECHDICRKNQYIDGKCKSGEYGLKKILELGKALNIPINFFVDIVEYREYGEAYMTDIIQQIQTYGQHIYLHLHPDYITGDHKRSFLWQYSYAEKKQILKAGFEDYTKFLGKDPVAFRIGRYGADKEMYQILNEENYSVIDLSYCTFAPKMCHLTEAEIKTKNGVRNFENQIVLPNTRYVGFRIGKTKKFCNLDTSESTFNEWKRYLKRTNLDNIVLTMHVWNFIKKYFFSDIYVGADKRGEKKFIKMIRFAQKKGFEFGDLEKDFNMQSNECDEEIDLCQGIGGRLQMLFNNYLRFQKIGRLNKKYFIVYTTFYVLILLLFLIVGVHYVRI